MDGPQRSRLSMGRLSLESPLILLVRTDACWHPSCPGSPPPVQPACPLLTATEDQACLLSPAQHSQLPTAPVPLLLSGGDTTCLLAPVQPVLIPRTLFVNPMICD